MNTLYINKVSYADVPYFLTRHSPFIGKRWEILAKPPSDDNAYILCYTDSGYHHYILRTREGFYYRLVISTIHPYPFVKSGLAPTLASLFQQSVKVPEKCNPPIIVHLPSVLDTFPVYKYEPTDVAKGKVGTAIIYRTQEGFYYIGTPTGCMGMVPSLHLLHSSLQTLL